MNSTSSNEEKIYSDDTNYHITRKKTTIEREALKRKDVAQEYISHLPLEITVEDYIPSALAGAIFCGHLVTDLDSVAGAIGELDLSSLIRKHYVCCVDSSLDEND
ncbi:hypothetical protein EON65_48105 [archaeon]|nr:MAG: hypothetical protein EON65_48105 [archaeon]